MKNIEMKCNECGNVFGSIIIEEESIISEVFCFCPKDNCGGCFSI